jgi:hypothetical protein
MSSPSKPKLMKRDVDLYRKRRRNRYRRRVTPADVRRRFTATGVHHHRTKKAAWSQRIKTWPHQSQTTSYVRKLEPGPVTQKPKLVTTFTICSRGVPPPQADRREEPNSIYTSSKTGRIVKRSSTALNGSHLWAHFHDKSDSSRAPKKRVFATLF